jgi:pyridoxamine 5'-phosphate oxidase
VDRKEILAFINAHPDSYFATIDGSRPRVRPIGTFRADENGLIYAFQSDKDVYKQLVRNPEVEICYCAEGTTVRISGRVQESKDLALKKQILEKRQFYKPGIEKVGWDYVGTFILKHGKAAVIDKKAPPGAPKVITDF